MVSTCIPPGHFYSCELPMENSDSAVPIQDFIKKTYLESNIEQVIDCLTSAATSLFFGDRAFEAFSELIFHVKNFSKEEAMCLVIFRQALPHIELKLTHSQSLTKLPKPWKTLCHGLGIEFLHGRKSEKIKNLSILNFSEALKHFKQDSTYLKKDESIPCDLILELIPANQRIDTFNALNETSRILEGFIKH